MNQILIAPNGQLVGPQGQLLGYTAVQTPQGMIAVPNQRPLGQPQAAPAPGAAPAPAMSSAAKLIVAAGIVGIGYWVWKKYIRPKTEDGKRSLREYAAQRSRSRLLAEFKRFLENHPEMREEFGAAEGAEEGAEEARELCEACEGGEVCEAHEG